METLRDLAGGMLSAIGYGVVGLLLLAIGYKVFDALLPGRLSTQIFAERNSNAALTVTSTLIALGTIVTTAIVTSDDSFGEGISSTAGYGLLGVVLLAGSFVVIDRLTPGSLGVICTDRDRHPAVYVTMASHLALGAIVAASIS